MGNAWDAYTIIGVKIEKEEITPEVLKKIVKKYKNTLADCYKEKVDQYNWDNPFEGYNDDRIYEIECMWLNFGHMFPEHQEEHWHYFIGSCLYEEVPLTILQEELKNIENSCREHLDMLGLEQREVTMYTHLNNTGC